ncbi:PAS domain-containing hybrid sensor histidine kinase/response regulator [Paenibacillus sp. DMB20]|uniref:PAS domain-containing hybrid sensor histidine kinase/response regulator n=1 Tax=Paenibacillus sp. DMB20 TaxID=1642570 RepID=UPI0009E3C349|nr:PAS domain-containing hybrid sensor histidine kinase/response regulator [Paenibacillus sp. DMB20]
MSWISCPRNTGETSKKTLQQACKGNPLHYEYRLTHEDETVQYLYLRGNVTFDEKGKPIRINGIIQDITDRKEVELKLQETVERYTSLKKYNHDAVISLDLNGNIIHGNIMAEKLTGFSIKELEGMSLSRLVGTTNLRKILKESLNDASIDNNINSIKHKEGHLVEVITTIAPIIINSENVGFYVIAKDITEQKKLLIAKETAESTNRAKSAFLAMMSHEIRTPMNGVIGMTDLLMESTELNEEQKEYVHIIRKSGESLLNIINDILDFSKIESGKTTLVQEPFNIRVLVSETVDLLTAKAAKKGLKMAWSVSDQIPYVVIGDAERLKQVLINLIGNSLKFTFSGGVHIEVGSKQTSGKCIEIECAISDTGIGIQEEKIDQLFQPFYQLDHFMTRKHEGTGLGLAISKKLVDLMGGQIWVEPHGDDPGVTFKFTVIMDLAEPEGELREDVEAAEHADQSRRLNILVGEDNETNQLVIRKMLEKQGHAVSMATNGQEVLEKLQYRKYDLVFMDIQMPEMNGIEATRIIRRTFPPDHMPIIVAVTANALKGDRELCLASGMDEYITKPLKSAVLAEVIDRFFGTEKMHV